MTTLRVVTDEPTSLSGLVAKRIRLFLAEHRIKQIDVANAMGMSKAAFSKRVNGQHTMNLDEVEALATTLGVQPGVFLSGETPEPSGPNGGDSVPPLGLEPRTCGLKVRHIAILRPSVDHDEDDEVAA